MAKNNKGASFIDKMKNAHTVEEKQREAEASTREADSLTSAEIAKLNVSPDLVKALNKKRTERVGRRIAGGTGVFYFDGDTKKISMTTRESEDDNDNGKPFKEGDYKF
jgi:hypothetical protein